MTHEIKQNKPSETIKKKIYEGFGNEPIAEETSRQVTRVGVYGVLMKDGKMLLVRQKSGPYAGKLDFPGGGIEFGESTEQALRRELLEEVAMEFDSLKLIDNLTATIQVPQTPFNQSYTFHQIGMIYRLDGFRSTNKNQIGELQHIWINPQSLSEDQCSSLLWKYYQLELASHE